jgi:hypothetical protein
MQDDSVRTLLVEVVRKGILPPPKLEAPVLWVTADCDLWRTLTTFIKGGLEGGRRESRRVILPELLLVVRV